MRLSWALTAVISCHRRTLPTHVRTVRVPNRLILTPLRRVRLLLVRPTPPRAAVAAARPARDRALLAPAQAPVPPAEAAPAAALVAVAVAAAVVVPPRLRALPLADPAPAGRRPPPRARLCPRKHSCKV